MEYLKIKNFAEVVSGSTPKTGVEEYWNGEYPWITPAEIGEKTKYVYDTSRKVSELGIQSASLKILRKGTVLLTSRAPIGKVAIAGVDLYCNQGFKNLVCDEKLVYPMYIYYWLSSKTDYLNGLGRGATFKEISKSIVEEIEVPVPTLETQQKIANALDKAQQLIEKRKEQIEACDELIKSQFIEMFGDIQSNPYNWDEGTFGDISKVRQGLQIPISKRKIEPAENCLPYITIQFLNGGKQAEYIENPKENVICSTDDILMTRTGNTGMVISNVEGVFHNNFFLIDFNRELLSKTFLIQYLKSNYIQSDIIRRAGTSTIPDLNHGEFYKIKVYLPPIELQNQFAQFVQQVDKLKFDE